MEGIFYLECDECETFWVNYAGVEFLRKINDDWNHHLKESHNDR
jgi:hypothetical protein